MSELNLEFLQQNDPLIGLNLTRKFADNTRSPADLTGAILELFIKTSINVSDTDPSTVKYSTTGGQIVVLPPPTDGRIEIQFLASDIGGPSSGKRFHLDVIKNAKRTTYAFGRLLVINT